MATGLPTRAVSCPHTHHKTTNQQIPLPPRIDPSVTMMTVEEKPDVTYDDVGGAGEALKQVRPITGSWLGSRNK